MTDMKIVTFKKEWRGYAIGEIAGFDSDAAASLIKSGRAVAYVAPSAAEKAPPSGTPKKVTGRKGGKVSDPVEPADPVDPVEPVDPIDPIDDPVDPLDPVDPADLDEKP